MAAAFRRAALIIAPHGAGLANIAFASVGTPVIEICFDDTNALFPSRPRGIECPDMYALLGINLGLPYWVTIAQGVHSSPMEADIEQLQEVTAQALLWVTRSPGAMTRDAGGQRCGEGFCSDCCDGEAYPPTVAAVACA